MAFLRTQINDIKFNMNAFEILQPAPSSKSSYRLQVIQGSEVWKELLPKRAIANGYGYCASCGSCSGYMEGGEPNMCECGHHYMEHN